MKQLLVLQVVAEKQFGCAYFQTSITRFFIPN